MKPKILVKSKESHSYPIFIGTGLLENLSQFLDFSQYFKIALVTDKKVGKLYAKKVLNQLPQKNTILISAPAGEKSKSLSQLKNLWQIFLKNQFDRQSLVIALGGGMTGDLAGFAAASFMRGIDLLQIPTSLLAQVDSSIGGKVAVNLQDKKNVLGDFHQPIAVIIDVKTLQTLDKRNLRAGFAEVLKYGLAQDKKFLEKIINKDPINLKSLDWLGIIKRACQLKAEIVEEDEKEKGKRAILNFGHTIGHAIEAAAKFKYLHGEAVAIGMSGAAILSQKQGLISKAEAEEIKNWLQTAGLPIFYKGLKENEIFQAMLSDKKRVQGKSKFVLLKEIGKAIQGIEISQNDIKKAIQDLKR